MATNMIATSDILTFSAAGAEDELVPLLLSAYWVLTFPGFSSANLPCFISACIVP